MSPRAFSGGGHTFTVETTATFVRVYHQAKVVFEREVDFFGDVIHLRNAREEAEKLVAFLKEYPDAETVPLAEGWRWRNLRS